MKFYDDCGKEVKPVYPINDSLIMWDCECGCIYSKEQKSCPVCKSKKRKVSKHRNFTPIEADENDTLTINWEMKI